MSPDSPQSARRSLRLIPFLLALVALFMFGTVVFATWFTINTNNNAVDTSAWSTVQAQGTAYYTDACQTPAPGNANEIKNAWFSSDGTYLNFRVEMCNSGEALGTDTTLRMIAGIDCNNDGDFTDPYVTGPDGDRLVVYYNGTDQVTLTDGGGNPVKTVPNNTYAEKVPGSTRNNIEWKVPIEYLPPDCRGSVESHGIAWTTVRVAPTPAVTLDFSKETLVWSNPIDYGDAFDPTATPLPESFPDPCATVGYDTRLECDGARHGIGPTPDNPLRFGSEALDPDGGDSEDVDAVADDIAGTTPDDEAGIAPTSGVLWKTGSGGGSITFTIQGPNSGVTWVGCWVDWNKNGYFETPGSERIVSQFSVSAPNSYTRTFTVPSTVTFPNSFYARCRVYPQPPAPGSGTPTVTPAPSGPYPFGEVEDHVWSFDATGAYIPPAGATDTPTPTITLTPTPTETLTPTPTITPATPVVIADLAIAVATPGLSTPSPSDVRLSWSNPAPNNQARVLYSVSNPYFLPTDGSAVPLGVVTAEPWGYTMSDVFGLPLPVQTYYYNVLGRVDDGWNPIGEAEHSNWVGLFEFELVPGLTP